MSQAATGVGRMTRICAAGHMLSLGVLTVWPWVWNQNKPTWGHVRGSFLNSEQRNRLSRYWFRYSTFRCDCLWPVQPNMAQLCFENWWGNIYRCLHMSASRAFKEVWRIQGLVFSGELSVRKSVGFSNISLSVRNSVSDCHILLYVSFLFCVFEEV